MPEADSVCPRCDAEVRGDWTYCPQCSMMLSGSQAILSDRIRYVRQEREGRSRRTAVVKSLANLSVALSFLFVVGSGIVLFHPSMVPSLFSPPETVALEPLPRIEDVPEVSDAGSGRRFAWVTVPAGSYQSGRPDRAVVREVPAFQILKYEVTNWQWEKFLEVKGGWLGYYRTPRDKWVPGHWQWVGPDWPPSPKPEDYDKPVVNITWDQANDFCREYVAKLPGCEGARLPWKYEWEKAARGAGDKRIYPWGNEFLLRGRFVRCNSYAANRGEPVPVDAFLDHDISPFGVVGMGGNVAEYVNAAEYDSYLVAGYCGGTYQDDEYDVRVYHAPTTQDRRDVKSSFVGFRVVRPVPEKKEEGE
jgi:formylglycine-generating enzyme required for sulfatase activity